MANNMDLQTLENEVMAWRSRFRQYEYRPQDDCIALKSAFKSGGEQHVDAGSGDASSTPEPCAALVGFVEGAWVANFSNPDRPLIARVKDAYEFSGEALLDLVLYQRDGVKVGRVSPVCGGPRNFEPACPASAWELIEEPDFEYLSKAGHHWGDRVKRIKTLG